MPNFFYSHFLLKLSTAVLLAFPSINFAHNPTQAEQGQVTLFLPIVSSVQGDLAEQLEQSLEAQGIDWLTLQNADFWHPYQQGLRKGRTGIYFAQPHFAAWAINQHKFTPIFKLHGSTKFVLAAPRDDSSLFEVRDLAGKTICREAGLNLGTVWLNQVLGKHRITALSKELPSVEQHLQTATKQNLVCDAFIVADFAYERINIKQRGHYIRLAQSPVYEHNAFIAHPDVSDEQITEFQSALKSKRLKQTLKPYFSGLSKWQNLLPIEAGDYDIEDSDLLKPYWGE